MDWNSNEGRALLWRAYPDGYLYMRGVRTVGGWESTSRLEANGELNWTRPTPDVAVIDVTHATRTLLVAHATGDLLPLPCIEDHATWGCMLAELALEVGMHDAYALAWLLRLDAQGHKIGWILSGTSKISDVNVQWYEADFIYGTASNSHFCMVIPADEVIPLDHLRAAEALVKCRALLNQK